MRFAIHKKVPFSLQIAADLNVLLTKESYKIDCTLRVLAVQVIHTYYTFFFYQPFILVLDDIRY